jgi:hypothetical protein
MTVWSTDLIFYFMVDPHPLVWLGLDYSFLVYLMTCFQLHVLCGNVVKLRKFCMKKDCKTL